jgi:hypothetical protein
MTFVNDGSAGAPLDLAPENVLTAYPAKDRGLYFDGSSDGGVRISGLVLSHTFAVHTWVLLKTVGVPVTIFSKDKNRGKIVQLPPDRRLQDVADKRMLELGLSAEGKLEARMADYSGTFSTARASESTTNINTW